MARQSDPPATDQLAGDVVRTRQTFAAAVHRRLDVLGIDPKQRTTWIVEAFERRKKAVRWQTAQHWLEALSFPQGWRLATLAEVLGMNIGDLVGPLRDDDDAPPAYRVFAAGEGSTMTDAERWALRLFPWPKEPTVGDYRSLLATLRSNAERA